MLDASALFTLSYGLYVVGAQKKDGYAGRVLDAFAQIAGGEQPRVVAGFMKDGDTVAAIRESKVFSVSVLPQDAQPFLIANFGFQSGANTDKWANTVHEIQNGLPVLRDMLAYLFCEVEEIREYETHTVCICKVVSASNGRKAEPMLYAQYHKSIKLQAQAAFRAFQEGAGVPQSNLLEETVSKKLENAIIKDAQAEQQWVCTLCGYVYDGETPFEELPDDWLCPLCGAPKSAFEKE